MDEVLLRDGPREPRFPLALVHPRGPIFRLLPLSLRRHLLYVKSFWRWGNFRQPRRWSEKVQWRVINDVRALLQVGAEKLASKEFVRAVVERNSLQERVKIPETYWVGTDLRELESLANRLPQRWVLKPNHTSGRYIVIDSSKSPVDWPQIIQTASRWIEADEQEYMLGHRLYQSARHLLFAEQRIGDGEESPDDLRILAFGERGIPPNLYEIQCSFGAHTEQMVTFRYSSDFVRKQGVHPADAPIDSRSLIDDMDNDSRMLLLLIGRLLAEPFDHVRVDFYFDGTLFWFGEMAVYPASGLSPFADRFDIERGLAWSLPDLTLSDPREAEWRMLLERVPRGTLQ